jgi:hypothetical protein
VGGIGLGAGNGADIDLTHGGEQAAELRALGVVALRVAGAPAVVGLAGQQHLLEALRAAQAVGALDEVEERAGAQLVDLVDQPMVAGGDDGEWSD